MTETEIKKIEKEIQGLTAKLRWDHIAEPTKDRYRERIEELRELLKASDSI